MDFVREVAQALYQRYIFTASESAANYPVCSPYFEDYYNSTWTYKLDSTIRWIEDCLDLLRKDYFFYLAFENSLAEDYVTEKILYPLMHYTVPIVYGGADYSRFLPPGSYIDAGKLSADEVASLILKAINYRHEYEDYFRWHNHYEYKEFPAEADVCSLCKLLNTHEDNTSIVNNFRKWWNPDYEIICVNEGMRI
ncbi:alpha-(1,3)-fucosyltransferase C-like [Leptidea sinapis]|uniref:alpha-(1,3)-fucosyltransferase C-like n=1 Tax=Leptidea sinapis TaxID=189913 RepID=UPI0021C42697|nr:alpha-(1,3)-fucosyltransferase C-like [Leptidea sinapis]